jgi:hypothetical protein
MANALGTLFQDIADAIRVKTGGTETMAPLDFPNEILSIVVGEGGTSDGSADNLRIATGSVSVGSTDVYQKTVTHGLDEMPDFVAVFMLGAWSVTGEAYTELLPLVSAWGLKSDFSSLSTRLGGYSFSNIGVSNLSNGIDETPTSSSSAQIYCPDESTFKFGMQSSESGQGLLCPNTNYFWIAIAGLGSSTGGASGAVKVKFCNYDGTELFSRQVFIGDDCPDPVTQGKITAPTKESSAQYNYTHSGWSLSAGGSANSAALKNITEDRTVYAAYSGETRYYTISFYDGTTLLKTEQYAYGQTPAYEPTKDDHGFIGWEPALTVVTGDKSYYAQWSAIVTFENASWQQIAEISESGQAAEKFAIGDKKTFTLTIDGVTETVEVEIAGFGLDTLSSMDGKAGITLISTHTHNFNKQTGYVSFGSCISPGFAWQSSRLRTYMNGKVYNGLPESLRSVVKQVSKKCTISQTPTHQYVDDYCWVPSFGELGLSYDNTTSIDTEITYPIFTNDTSRIRYKSYNASTKVGYYVRDAKGTSGNYLGSVSSAGKFGSYGDALSYAVLCFCI